LKNIFKKYFPKANKEGHFCNFVSVMEWGRVQEAFAQILKSKTKI